MEATKGGNNIRIENCAKKHGAVSFKALDVRVASVLCKMLEYFASNTESKNLQKTCIFWENMDLNAT